MNQKDLLEQILDAFDEAPIDDPSLSANVVQYCDRHGVWTTWLEEPQSNLRDDDFHAVGFRMEKVLCFSWKGQTVYLTGARIQDAIRRCE